MTHPLLSGLASGQGLLATDPAAGRQALTELWEGLDSSDAAARCILGHFLADAQDDLDDEIAWDKMSLVESAKTSDDELRAIHPAMRLAGFMSSLHLNLADGYRRLGRFELAGRHLKSSLDGNSALNGDEPDEIAYRDLIITGQQRVAAAIEAGGIRLDSRPTSRHRVVGQLERVGHPDHVAHQPLLLTPERRSVCWLNASGLSDR